MKNQIIITIALFILFFACKKVKNEFDASGTFEAEEVIISTEATGAIRQLNIEEGQLLEAGQYVGFIDTTQLFLKKKQLQAQIQALIGKKPNISTQLASLQEQLTSVEREQKRIASLVKADAATPKQLDDVNAQVSILKKQIAAQQSSLGISSSGFSKEAQPIQFQIEQINDQLRKSIITNPIKGRVLSRYAEENEIAMPGKPIYKIANLDTIYFRAYITGDQLSQIQLAQKVKVVSDDGPDHSKETEGTITWISDEAEFTPKTILTKDERANTVYAIKVKVPNDGMLKIGMYGQLKFVP